jgi:cellulose synthase/poly-beta-1,6-N-acetylglucosamine synthase-like glycosyltransferase
MLTTFFSLAATLYSIFVIPPVVYLLCISIAGMKKPQQKSIVQDNTAQDNSSQKHPARIGILVPAHNETLTIERTITSLLQAVSHSDNIDITIIADNCSDNTAELARKYSVNVLERTHDFLRGKGAALQWAMAQLADEAYDYTMVIDADSIVNESYFCDLRMSLGHHECEVVQTRYEALANEHSSIKRLAMLGFNVLRARGRVSLGGSAGIMGNGFIVSKAALEKVPFKANSIVEDLEYHMRLVESDISVRYCDSARIYGEMPTDDTASDVQSSRWEGGRLGVLKAMWWPLLKKSCTGIVKKELHALDALLDLMLLPIGYMVMVLLIGLLFSYTQATALLGFVAIGIYVIGAAMCGNGMSELTVLKKLPSFLFKKIMRIPALIASSATSSNWNRTPRDKEH